MSALRFQLQRAKPQPHDETPLPEGRDLAKCEACDRRRQCAVCVCCDQRYCGKCSRRLKPPKSESWLCEGCEDEAADFRRYGVWGPP